LHIFDELTSQQLRSQAEEVKVAALVAEALGECTRIGGGP
jgi:hypothetical protein